MIDRGAAERRQDQDRRTTAARRGVRIAGAVGAAGTALAIGAATAVAHASERDDPGSTSRDHTWVPSQQQSGTVGERGERDEGGGDDGPRTRAPRPPKNHAPAPSTSQLAAPGGSGPSHSSSSGS